MRVSKTRIRGAATHGGEPSRGHTDQTITMQVSYQVSCQGQRLEVQLGIRFNNMGSTLGGGALAGWRVLLCGLL